MVTATTNGVTVRVETQYLAEHSNPTIHKFVFGYHIRIENGTAFTIQLLRRHWRIVDGNGSVHTVDGEGVVGRQPIIQPGESHEYVSFCNLTCDMGKMSGAYKMIRTDDTQQEFEVEIPAFDLIYPWKLN